MKVQDIFILGLSLLIVTISFIYEGTWEIDNEWFIKSENNSLLTPLIVDINNDNINEIIMTTNIPSIQIFGPNQKLIKEKDLRILKLSKGRKPINIATGIFHKNDKEHHIIILTDSANLICLDHQLNIIWERSLDLDIYDDLYIAESYIIIDPTSLYINDQGVILIGLKFKSKNNPNIHESIKKTRSHLLPYIHFSVFAFDAKTGSKRWIYQNLSQLNQYHQQQNRLKYLNTRY